MINKTKKYKLLILIIIFCSLINNIFCKNLLLKINKEKERKNFFLTKEEENVFKNIETNIQNKHWAAAYETVKKIKTPGYENAIKLYVDYSKFKQLDNNSNINGLLSLIDFDLNNEHLHSFAEFDKKIAKLYISNKFTYEQIKDYFDKKNLDDNVQLAIKLFSDNLRFINEFSDENEKKIQLEKLTRNISNFWIFHKFENLTEENNFYNTFQNFIKESETIYKIKLLIFNRKDFANNIKFLKLEKNINFFKILEDILTHLSNDHNEKLFKIINSDFKNNEIFLFTKVLYYRNKQNNEEVINILMNELKEDGNSSEYWWKYKDIYVRNLIKELKYKEAYKLAKSFKGPKGVKYLESEWLCGWISYIHLKNYNTAINHFNNCLTYAYNPISIANNAYWLGRIYHDIGKDNEAIKYYNKASKYPLTFYGQLAHYNKYNILHDRGIDYKEIDFPELPIITDKDQKENANNHIIKLGILFYKYLDEKDKGNKIFKFLISKNLKTKGQIADLIEDLELLEDEMLIVQLSIQAANKMVFFIHHLFPTLKIVKNSDQASTIVHSIIKQESTFILNIKSLAGAIGFMQIMPSTAKQLCKQLNITYNEYRLNQDAYYNIALGKYYINELLRKYKGSKVLAIAAYNAGEGHINRWIKSFGDPRENNEIHNVINWMEMIPFKETRNYLQRVLENLIVYEYLLNIKK